jgi:hypothetical protein
MIQPGLQSLYQWTFTQSAYEIQIIVGVPNRISANSISILNAPNSLICRIGKEIPFLAGQFIGCITGFTRYIVNGQLVLALTKLPDREWPVLMCDALPGFD